MTGAYSSAGTCCPVWRQAGTCRVSSGKMVQGGQRVGEATMHPQPQGAARSPPRKSPQRNENSHPNTVYKVPSRFTHLVETGSTQVPLPVRVPPARPSVVTPSQTHSRWARALMPPQETHAWKTPVRQSSSAADGLGDRHREAGCGNVPLPCLWWWLNWHRHLSKHQTLKN